MYDFAVPDRHIQVDCPRAERIVFPDASEFILDLAEPFHQFVPVQIRFNEQHTVDEVGLILGSDRFG